MRIVIAAAALAVLASPAVAQQGMDWAYPVAPQGLPRPDPNKIVKVPGSEKEYTEVQVNNGFNPPDWFPNDHAPMPKIVAQGDQPNKVRACALCHLTSGDGHPESSGLAGLPIAYAIRQMAEFKNGNRTGIRTGSMVEIAKGISDADTRAAAEYFAARKPLIGYTKVVESATVPTSYVGSGAMRFASKDGTTEPIGNRIIELPQDEPGAHARNPRTGFVAHVPPGSIAKGAALARGGDGKTIACTICHGQGLRGLGEVPPIANRSPMYLFRQLNDMKAGNRKGDAMALMKAVVETLTVDDMIALSAYVGSLEP